jgi:hypothetical protein
LPRVLPIDSQNTPAASAARGATAPTDTHRQCEAPWVWSHARADGSAAWRAACARCAAHRPRHRISRQRLSRGQPRTVDMEPHGKLAAAIIPAGQEHVRKAAPACACGARVYVRVCMWVRCKKSTTVQRGRRHVGQCDAPLVVLLSRAHAQLWPGGRCCGGFHSWCVCVRTGW